MKFNAVNRKIMIVGFRSFHTIISRCQKNTRLSSTFQYAIQADQNLHHYRNSLIKQAKMIMFQNDRDLHSIIVSQNRIHHPKDKPNKEGPMSLHNMMIHNKKTIKSGIKVSSRMTIHI